MPVPRPSSCLPFRVVIVAPERSFHRCEGRNVWVVACWHEAQLPAEPLQATGSTWTRAAPAAPRPAVICQGAWQPAKAAAVRRNAGLGRFAPGALATTMPELCDDPKGIIYLFCGPKLSGHVWLQNHNICTRSIPSRVFAAHPLAEIVFRPHRVVVGTEVSPSSLCSHVFAAQVCWHTER